MKRNKQNYILANFILFKLKREQNLIIHNQLSICVKKKQNVFIRQYFIRECFCKEFEKFLIII